MGSTFAGNSATPLSPNKPRIPIGRAAANLRARSRIGDPLFKWATGFFAVVIAGTAVSSIIALLISVPISLGVAIFLVEKAPRKLSNPILFLVQLLAAIPSVVYGLWAIL